MDEDKQICVFSVVFGVFNMGTAAIAVIFPLKLADMGFSPTIIATVIGGSAVGMIFIKIFVGLHSDRIGAKPYLLFALALGFIILCGICFAKKLWLCIMLNALFGISKGIMSSISSAYTVTMSSKNSIGNNLGKLTSVSNFLSCLGGIFSGLLYFMYQGNIILLFIATLFCFSIYFSNRYLPSIQSKNNDNLIAFIAGINPRLYIFCGLVFLQSFILEPIWGVYFSLHCYTILGLSSVVVGIMTSLDELLASPASLIAGKLSKKLTNKSFLLVTYLLVAITAFLWLFTKTVSLFLVLFLLCSMCIAGTHIAVSTAATSYMRKHAIGFEFSLISLSGALGSALGYFSLGAIFELFSIYALIFILFILYLGMMLIAKISVK